MKTRRSVRWLLLTGVAAGLSLAGWLAVRYASQEQSIAILPDKPQFAPGQEEYLALHPDSAIRYYSGLLQTGGCPACHIYRIEVYRRLGKIYFTDGSIAQARDCFEQGLALARAHSLLVAEANALNDLGILAAREGSASKALGLFQQALALCTPHTATLSDYQPMVNAASNIGNVYVLRGEQDSAERYYQQALALGRKSPGPVDTNKVLHNIASLYNIKGDIYKSFYTYYRLIRIFEKSNNEQELAKIYSNIGMMMEQEAQLDSASAFYARALKINRKYGNAEETLLMLLHLADIRLVQESVQATLPLMRECDSLMRRVNTYVATYRYHYQYGNLYYFQQKFPEAQARYQQAFDLAFSKGNKIQQADALTGIAYCQIARKQPVIALQTALKAQKLADEVQKASLPISIHETLYKCYKANGNTAKALEHYERYIALNNNLANNSLKQQISVLRASYEQDRLKATYAHDLAARDRSVEQQRWWMVVGSLLLAFALIVAGLTMHNSRKLRQAYSNLEGANAAIEGQKARIEEQAAGLAAVNATKDRLFSILAHDLRSPVATLRGALELGLQGKVGPDAFMALLPNLHRSVVGMQVILENLLHWSLAQVRGGARGNAVPFPLESIIEENVLLLSETARAKQIHLESRILPGLHVMADRDQLSLVIRNLISNALKFTPAGGEIWLYAEKKEEFVQVSVQDSGVGMTEEQVSHLFRGGANTSTRGTGGEKGTGLGLLLCKELVTGNGGTIWAQSTPGEGSLFQFLVPVAPASLPLPETR